MQSSEVLLACHGCEQKLPLRCLGYNKEGKRLLCSACNAGKPARDTPLRKQVLEKTGPRMRNEEDFVRYICAECRFRFSRARTFTFRKCPYCASTGPIIDAVFEQQKERKWVLDDLYG